MSASLAKKYAGWLRGSDIVELFESLERLHGSISKAAKACGLERKTVYDWKRKAGAEDLKAATKTKVVAALLEQVPEEALDSMLGRLLSQVRELLEVYLSTLYEHAMEESDQKEFVQLAGRFGDALSKYAGLVAGGSEVETSTMLQGLAAKAGQLGESLTIPPMMVFSSEQLERLLPAVLAETRATSSEDSEEIQGIARRLRIAPSIVRVLASPLPPREELVADTRLIPMRPTDPLRLDRLNAGSAMTLYHRTQLEIRDMLEGQTKTVGGTEVPAPWCPQ